MPRSFAMFVVALALAAGAAAAGPSAAAAPAGATYPTAPTRNDLSRSDSLVVGHPLFSDPGHGIEFDMQADGNLVLTAVSARRVLWSSHTTGANNRLEMQSDGNAVIYSSAGRALWATNTAGSGATDLIVTSGGNVVVSGSGKTAWTSPNRPAAGNAIVLSTLISPNGHYRALMQTDGNFVVSSASTGALWSSGTAGHPGSLLELQYSDGNLVIYGPSALWSTHTSGPDGTYLVMQDDGNLVLYKGIGNTQPVWSSQTAGRP